MGEVADELVVEGAQALAVGDWETAQASFTAAVELTPSGAALAGLGDALWWQGRIAEAIQHRERAYAAFRREGEVARAASVALRLAVDNTSNVGNRAVSAGWLARADTLVAEHELHVLTGWLDMVRAFTAAAPAAAEAPARRAVQQARERADHDLELQALSVLGAVLVELGRTEEGVACLDEAMAGSLGGEPADPGTVVFTSCNMIKACASCADLERAVEWVLAADRFREHFGCAFLYASCRTQYGRVLTTIGDWGRAEEELQAAIAAAASSLPAIHADAVAALAELRIGQGDLSEGQRLVALVEGHPQAVAVAARLHLLNDQPVAAEALVARRLAAVGDEGLEGGRLTELLGEVELAQARPAPAAALAERLVATAEASGCRVLAARGHRLAGRAAARAGDAAAAETAYERAVAGFSELGCLYEAARTRALLAELLASVTPQVAEMEGRGAHAVFDRLGARQDADAVAALLRRLGVRVQRGTAAATSLLTDREQEVLGLVRDGLSNPEIAARLFISRRTVEHHVASILAKLGVRSRTEAAVHTTP